MKQRISKNESEIVKEFNKFFTTVDTAFASKILIYCNATIRFLTVILLLIDFYDSIKIIPFKNFKASLEESDFSKKEYAENLFFQFFPKCMNVLCRIVCLNIS